MPEFQTDLTFHVYSYDILFKFGINWQHQRHLVRFCQLLWNISYSDQNECTIQRVWIFIVINVCCLWTNFIVYALQHLLFLGYKHLCKEDTQSFVGLKCGHGSNVESQREILNLNWVPHLRCSIQIYITVAMYTYRDSSIVNYKVT